MGQQIVIDARMKKSKDGHCVHCGQCSGELGYIPPTTGGWSSRPVMIPPDNPQLSAAPGYSQRYDEPGANVADAVVRCLCPRTPVAT